jgi:hypothetical protein
MGSRILEEVEASAEEKMRLKITDEAVCNLQGLFGIE